MGRVIIAGAGGFGRELAAYVRDMGLEVAGFLDQHFRVMPGQRLAQGSTKQRMVVDNDDAASAH